jgi:hypothetical protein
MFKRSMNGVPWGGFWSRLETAVDVSEYKYVYVDVWKPRVSPVKFKLEDGPSANLEIESMSPQTKTEEWETLVFDFSGKDGTWNVIAFMPDFAEPVGLEEDIVIYFDNIRLGGPPEGKDGHGVMIEDFEHIALNWFAAGDEAYMHVVQNPDFENEVNPSGHVVEFSRGKGDPWGGFFSPLAEPLDLTENQYMYVDVWKPMTSRVVFKLEGSVTGLPNVELPSMRAQTKTEEWETLVFDFSEVGGQWGTITFFPDFPESADDVADDYIVMYFDNIRQGGPPEDMPSFVDVDFVWSDFSIDGLTNVEGFRDPSDGTVATDVPDAGVDGGPIVELVYEVSADMLSTRYRMWAYPSADVSAYNQLVLNVKAAEATSQVGIYIRDTENAESRTYVDIGTEWEQIIIPVPDMVPVNEGQFPDLSILQAVFMVFNHEVTDPGSGTVHLDLVGFNYDANVSVPDVSQDQQINFMVYPNPATSVVHVQTQTDAMVSLIDIRGNLISQKQASSGTMMFDLAGLAKGIYLIRVVSNETSGTQKFIVY